MQFKVGQKVCFLNEKREGIITKIINNKMVSVAIEDGFEIPVLINEVAPIIMPDHLKEQAAVQLNNSGDKDEQQADDVISSIYVNSADTVHNGLFLAYVPENQNNISASALSVFLVNNTAYDLLFCYFLKSDGKFLGADYDRLDSESKYLLQSIDRSQIEEWAEIKFQLLFFRKNSSYIKAPLDKEIKIKPVKFFREENFKFNKMLNQRCVLFNITGTKTEETDDIIDISNEKTSDPEVANEVFRTDLTKTEAFPEKHIIDRKVAEVDLHIDELFDSIEGMTNNEMLAYQVNYFIKMLESAIANKFFKIVFIHGVGNGKLKEEIRKILKESYPFLKTYDATTAKYGIGATEVQIPVNTYNLQNKHK
jgi:hypothetical protein